MAMKPNPYLDYLLEQFAPLGIIHARAMFGGHCLYANGVTFALVAGHELYLKADLLNRPDFEARGLTPFRPFPDQDLVMQYYAAPPELFESLEGLRQWAGGAIAAGKRAAAKKKKRAKPPAHPKSRTSPRSSS